MLVVLALAAVAVIAGVTVVAMGRGGELGEFAPDVPPLDLPKAGRLGAVDFMGLQIPVSLIGYHTQTVDEALNSAAGALSERDTRIAVLEQRVSELLASRLQARHELNPGRLASRDLGVPYGPAEAGQPSDGSPALSYAGEESEEPAEPERRPEREEPSTVEEHPESEESPDAAEASRSPESSEESSGESSKESSKEPSEDSPGTRPDAVGARTGERPGTEESR